MDPGSVTGVEQLADGYYAFSTDESGKCVRMIYNPGNIILEDGKIIFSDRNQPISDEALMTATFEKLSYGLTRDLTQSDSPRTILLSELSRQVVLGSGGEIDEETKNKDGVFQVLSQKIIARTYGKLYSYS